MKSRNHREPKEGKEPILRELLFDGIYESLGRTDSRDNACDAVVVQIDDEALIDELGRAGGETDLQ